MDRIIAHFAVSQNRVILILWNANYTLSPRTRNHYFIIIISLNSN